MTLDDLISPAYREEQIRLHQAPRGYGGKGRRWSTYVKALAWTHDCDSILDYGCGEGSLAVHLLLIDPETREPLGRIHDVRQYDPAMPGLETLPEPADCVVCTDVLEHVEPEKIGAVLDHLCELARKILFVVISTVETAKLLGDGRQAHILLMEPSWWQEQFATRGYYVVDEPRIRPDKQWCAALRRA